MNSLGEFGRSLLLVALVVAVFWAVRRFSPPLRCPRCGAVTLIFLGDMKECSRCGHLFS